MDIESLYRDFNGCVFTCSKELDETLKYEHQLRVYSVDEAAYLARLFYAYAKSEFAEGEKPLFNRFLPMAQLEGFWATCFVDLLGDTSVFASSYEDDERFLTTKMLKVAGSLDDLVERSIKSMRDSGYFHTWVFELY